MNHEKADPTNIVIAHRHSKTGGSEHSNSNLSVRVSLKLAPRGRPST